MQLSEQWYQEWNYLGNSLENGCCPKYNGQKAYWNMGIPSRHYILATERETHYEENFYQTAVYLHVGCAYPYDHGHFCIADICEPEGE